MTVRLFIAHWKELDLKDFTVESKYKFVDKKIGGAAIKVYAGRPQTVYEMYRNTAARYPQREAIKFADICLTYNDLGKRVDALASILKEEHCVNKGDRVAVFLKNDHNFPPVFLATSKVGAISVILNTRLTKPELEYQLKLTAPTLAVVDDEIWDKGLDTLSKNKIVKSSLNLIWDRSGSCPPVDCDEEDVHTILFTSGTTGKPKGVRILHRNFIRSAITFEQYMKILVGTYPENGGKTLIAAPLFHVMALQTQLIGIINMGGTAILLSQLSVIDFLKTIEKERVDFLAGSPAIYRILLSSEHIQQYDLSSVKVAGFGAAPMSPDLMIEMQKVFPNARFYNGFGLTEASASLAAIDRECIEKPASIGRPTLGCEVKIVDDDMKEVPEGFIGEIAVKGASVTGGYYNNPEATGKAFINGWFLTGDLGKVDGDGFYYVVSRKKDMINRGGENVYPVEVENTICMHPKVFEVAVYGVPDRIMGEKVAASIIAVPGTPITSEEIKEFCIDKLARYKIPEYIVFASALPKNPGGKVVKEQLRSELVSKLKSKNDMECY